MNARRCVGWVLGCALATAGVAAPVRIQLRDGLALTDRAGSIVRAPLEMDLDLPDPSATAPGPGALAWAWSPALPGSEHPLKIETLAREGDGWQIRIGGRIAPHRGEPLATGGQIGFVLHLNPAGPGAWSGTYRATPTPASAAELADLERAWGYGPVPGLKDPDTHRLLRARDLRLAEAPWEGAARGESNGAATPGPPVKLALPRPRLLFTAEQLPAIRDAAATPEGHAILAALTRLLERAEKHGFSYHPPGAEHSMGNLWSAGHAFLFQLTGDQAHARRAEQLARSNLFGNYYYGGGWLHPYTLLGLACAYDWPAHTWDPGFRAMVYSYLWKNARQLALCDDTPDPLSVSNRYRFANDQAAFQIRSATDPSGAQFRAAAAMGALAILGDPPPAYRPADPGTIATLDPATGYEPPPGVPVLPFESDVMPREWLLNGPFLGDRTDLFAGTNGAPAGLRPIPGDFLTSDGTAVEWRHYRPNGAADPGGGSIYARVCARSWASSTGGGYGPGIELVRRWTRERGQPPSLRIALFTVIANDRDRVVQALPNWRSASWGNRMWLNGRELRDGDLVRIAAGLYPLLVDVALVGGYSSQAPRLREYTPADRRADTAAADAAARAAFSDDPTVNPLLGSVHAIRRSLLRQASLRVGSDGWRIWETQEAVLPFARTWLGLTGEETATALGIRDAASLVVRLSETWEPTCFRYLAWAGLSLFAREDQATVLGIARTHTEFRRPTEAILALIGLALLPPPPVPRAIPPAGSLPSHGIDAFRARDRNLLALIQSGNAPFTDGAEAGHFATHGFGRGWIEWRDGADPSNGNVLAIGDLEPAAPATIVARQFEPDGSGSVVMDLESFRPRVTPGSRKAGSPPPPRPDPNGPRVRRHFTVDYSGGDGATLLIADRIERAAFLEKVWRFDLGQPGGFLNERTTATGHGVRYREHDIVVAPPPGRGASAPPGTMQIVVHAPARLHWSERSGNREGTRRILEARLDRAERTVEREARAPSRADTSAAPGVPGLEDLEQELGEQTRTTARAAAPPLWVITVINLQRGEPPTVGVETPGEAARVRIGDRRYRLTPEGWRHEP